MKKRITHSFLILSLHLVAFTTGAQSLGIGQSLPEHTVTLMPTGPSAAPQTLSFGHKPLLLGFWNTHCQVTLRFLPALDSLQEAFRGKMQVVLITREPAGRVIEAANELENLKKVHLPVVAGDTVWRKRFPHRVQPHFVWIGSGGKVLAITGHEEVTREHLDALIKDQLPPLPLKEEPADPNVFFSLTPLMINEYEKNKQKLNAYSYIGGPRTGISSMINAAVWNKADSTMRIHATNQTRESLYKMAYQQFLGFHSNRMVWEESQPAEEGAQNKQYCYDLILRDTATAKAYRWMRQDLDRHFSCSSRMEKRNIKVLVLKQNGKTAAFKAKGEGAPDEFFTAGKWVLRNIPIGPWVEYSLNGLSRLPYPVLDETGFDGRLSMELSDNFRDVDAFRRSLNRYGLELVEEKRELEVLVIKDEKE